MEIGIHNVTVAIIVAVSVIGNEVMAVPAAVYGVVMFVPAGILAYLLSRRAEPSAQPATVQALSPGLAEADRGVQADAAPPLNTQKRRGEAIMPAFDGVRVLELGQIYNGPYCGLLLRTARRRGHQGRAARR